MYNQSTTSSRIQKPIRSDGVRKASSGPYTAKLLGWSDDVLAGRDFFLLVDAIRWLTQAEENGAIAKRASIYAADDKMVWTKLFARMWNQRERAMKQNAKRILIQVLD